MIIEEQIQQAVDILVREANPLKVNLFGSHARGDAREDSDVDFLVIEREVPNKSAEMVRLQRTLIPMRINADVFVASEEYTLSSWAGFPGTYLYDALREGRVMYALDGASALAAATGA
jgi:predicted nucleotidyltransferase